MLDKIKKIIKIFIETFKNVFSKADLLYIGENVNWVTDWIGFSIIKNLPTNFKARQTVFTPFIRNKILHFGSVGTFVRKNGIRKIHKSNKVVVTWFHIINNDPRLKYISELNQRADFIHTACQKTKEQLIGHGISLEKIIVIPLGIDLDNFICKSREEKEEIKTRLNLPENKTIIGSFQKDGSGWGEGNEPKMEKGPDVFCDVMERLAKEFNIHVLLTGPARGYVKKRLEKANITYTHNFFNNFLDIVDYYNVLDLYIVASRIEGGPKAIAESMACGVPIISTDVGLSPDVIDHQKDGILCEVEDRECLVKYAKEILVNNELKEGLVSNGFIKIKNYSWQKISAQYFERIYSKL